MKIAIVGAGAMGSVYAAHFAQAGHEVWAIDTWRAHIDAINADGLRLEGPNGADRRVHNLKAVSDVAQAGACDLYVIATKGAGVGAAAAQIAAVMKPTSLVLTIQNGLGASPQPELLKRRVGATAVNPSSIMMLLPSSVQSQRQRGRELPGSRPWP